MSSEIKVSSVKAKDGTAGISIADSTGNVSLSGTLSAGTLGSSVVFPAGGTGNPISVAMVADESSGSSNGGTATAYGSWATRNLDTEMYDPDGIVSLSSNQFTLGSGTYLLYWSAPAYKVDRHQTQIYDITAGATLEVGGLKAIGTNAFSNNADNTQTRSEGSFIHTITSNNVYELRHAVESTRSTNGLGVNGGGGLTSGWTLNSLYNYVIIYKLK